MHPPHEMIVLLSWHLSAEGMEEVMFLSMRHEQARQLMIVRAAWGSWHIVQSVLQCIACDSLDFLRVGLEVPSCCAEVKAFILVLNIFSILWESRELFCLQ